MSLRVPHGKCFIVSWSRGRLFEVFRVESTGIFTDYFLYYIQLRVLEVSSPFILTAHDPIKLTSFLNRWVATRDQLMSLKWKVCQKKTFWTKKFIELLQCMYVLSVWKHWQELASLTNHSHFCPHPLCSLNKMFQFFKCTTFNFVQLQIRINDKAVLCTN